MAANDILMSILEDYGLEDLYSFAQNLWVEGSTAADVLVQLRDQPKFKERFSGMDKRKENGLPAISVDDYIQLERDYQQAMAAYGLPERFYDEPEDFAEFIGNDVSATEVEERVALAAKATAEANKDLKQELLSLYNIDDADLTAYYLDPDRAVTVLEQRLQLESAGISLASRKATGQGLSEGVARELVDQNVQEREVSLAMAQTAGLTEETLGTQGLSSDEIASANFGLDSEMVARVNRLRQKRANVGGGGMGASAQQVGVTGLGSAQMS
tara:strand:+ start:10509 stop:11321 length:813 start_codon:yes stop_codon:yes gene_type:complete